MTEKNSKNAKKLFVGKKIKSFRSLNKLTQQEMAERLGISYRTYQDIENDITDVSLGRLQEIAEVLNTSVLEILGIGEGRFYFVHQESERNSIIGEGDVTITEKAVSEEIQELKYENTKLLLQKQHLDEKVGLLEGKIENLEKLVQILEEKLN